MSVEKTLKDLFALDGRVILLTGAAGGICSEMARTLAGAGATLALCDVREDAVQALCAELEGEGHTAHRVDLLDQADISRCVDQVLQAHGRIDGVINGAGISKRLGLLDVEEDLYDRIMDVNLKSAFFLTQEVVRKSMRFTGGKILNIASYNSTSICGGSSVYAMSKSAILGMTRSMAVEFGKYDIQANAIAPGFVATPLTKELEDDPIRHGRIVEMTCCRRMATPEDLMGMTVLLMGPASSYMTGHVYNIDGGALIGGSNPWPYPTKY